jgi:hypothetical protein
MRVNNAKCKSFNAKEVLSLSLLRLVPMIGQGVNYVLGRLNFTKITTRDTKKAKYMITRLD